MSGIYHIFIKLIRKIEEIFTIWYNSAFFETKNYSYMNEHFIYTIRSNQFKNSVYLQMDTILLIFYAIKTFLPKKIDASWIMFNVLLPRRMNDDLKWIRNLTVFDDKVQLLCMKETAIIQCILLLEDKNRIQVNLWKWSVIKRLDI